MNLCEGAEAVSLCEGAEVVSLPEGALDVCLWVWVCGGAQAVR